MQDRPQGTPGLGERSVSDILSRPGRSVDEILSELRQQKPPLTPSDLGRQPISGTYAGNAEGIYVEVRVDVDGARPLNLVSGDVFHLQGADADAERVYSHSFICRMPTIERKAQATRISGELSFFEARQEPTRLEVTIVPPPSGREGTMANVQFINAGGVVSTFTCRKVSDYFRQVELELDYLEGTELPKPVDTAATSPHPTDLPAKAVTLQGAYGDAGIEVKIPELEPGGPGIKPIPWQPEGEDGWSEAELHKLMEDYFSLYAPGPQWRLHLMVVNRSEDDPDWGGLMYDCIGDEATGLGYRQGAALFWEGLKGTVPPEQFWRYMMLSAVHELGHGLGLLHTFDPAKQPSPPYPTVASVSFMNYPMIYCAGDKAGDLAFLEKFRWEFDNAELAHLRHGDLMKVIPGGVMDAAFQGHATFREALRFLGAAQDKGGLRLAIASRPTFEFTEPVNLDLYLVNTHPEEARPAHAHLDPQEGLVQLAFCSPSGRIRYYQPLFKACAFKARKGALKAGAILHHPLVLHYGRNGFYFDEPGEYQALAFYRTPDGQLLASNTHRFRVTYPDKEEQRIAQDVFQPRAGKFLCLAGTDAYPATANNLLGIAEECPDRPISGYIRAAWGMNLASPFKRLFGGKVQARAPQPEEAARFLKQAIQAPKEAKRPLLSRAAYHSAATRLASLLAQQGKAEEAQSVLRRAYGSWSRWFQAGVRFATDFSDDYPGGVPPHIFNRYYGREFRAWGRRAWEGEEAEQAKAAAAAEEMRRMQEEMAQLQKLQELQASLLKAQHDAQQGIIRNIRGISFGSEQEAELKRIQEELARQQKLLEIQAQIEKAKRDMEQGTIGNLRAMQPGPRRAWWEPSEEEMDAAIEEGKRWEEFIEDLPREMGYDDWYTDYVDTTGAASAFAAGRRAWGDEVTDAWQDWKEDATTVGQYVQEQATDALQDVKQTVRDWTSRLEPQYRVSAVAAVRGISFQGPQRRGWVGYLNTKRFEEGLRNQQNLVKAQMQLYQWLQSKGLLSAQAFKMEATPQDVDKLIAECQKVGQEIERQKTEWQKLPEPERQQRATRDLDARRQAFVARAPLRLARALAPLRRLGWQFKDEDITEQKVDDLLKAVDEVEQAFKGRSAALDPLRKLGWSCEEDMPSKQVEEGLKAFEEMGEAFKARNGQRLRQTFASLRRLGWSYEQELSPQVVEETVKAYNGVKAAWKGQDLNKALGGLKRFGWEFKGTDAVPDALDAVLRLVQVVREEREAMKQVDSKGARAWSAWDNQYGYAFAQPTREQLAKLMELRRQAAQLGQKIERQQEHLNWMGDLQARTLGGARSFRSWTVDPEKRRWATWVKDADWKDPNDPWRERWIQT